MRGSGLRTWWLLALMALLAMPADAQKITATIRGTVTDPSRSAVEGAKVTLKGEETGFTRTTTTNKDGIYVFPELVVGSYRIEVEAPGFKAAARSKIGLSVAETRAVDVELSTGELT